MTASVPRLTWVYVSSLSSSSPCSSRAHAVYPGRRRERCCGCDQVPRDSEERQGSRHHRCAMLRVETLSSMLTLILDTQSSTSRRLARTTTHRSSTRASRRRNASLSPSGVFATPYVPPIALVVPLLTYSPLLRTPGAHPTSPSSSTPTSKPRPPTPPSLRPSRKTLLCDRQKLGGSSSFFCIAAPVAG